MQQNITTALPPSSKTPNYFPDDTDVQPPCQFACPIHQDIRSYVAYASLGRFKESYDLVKQTNPLSFICGTICAHPCETKCRREKVEEPISIRALKRSAIEYGKHEIPMLPITKRAEKVAVIGAGPAGLTAGHDLCRMGFQVTVFERETIPGGAVSLFIPLYRLPRKVIEEDIRAIQTLGVEIKTGMSLGKDFTLQDLKKQGFQAVLLALGLPVSRTLDIPGVGNENILLALPFLKAANSGNFRFKPGRDVIVIGGGNVAMDVARSALRCGAEKVKVACLEARHEMPAFPWEIEEAVEEGIEVNCSLGPKAFLIEQCDVKGMQCKAVRAVFDAQGRFNPSFYEDRLSTIPGNTLIISIGQAADIQHLKNTSVQLSERGQIIYDRDTLSTTDRGIFVCGEVAIGPATAVQAMASGRKAALSISRYLLGEQVPGPYANQLKELGTLANTTLEKVRKNHRLSIPIVDVAKRVHTFEPVEIGYSRDMAVAEARRCMSCGAGAYRIPDKCVECLTCVRVCPYGVPVVTELNSVDIRIDQCQACGLCVGECPAKAIGFRKTGESDLEAQVAEVLKIASTSKEPKIVIFYCSYTTRGQIYEGQQKPQGAIGVTCVSRVDVNLILKAFENGADGVILASCEDGQCPYSNLVPWGERRIKAVQSILKGLGFNESRLAFHTIAPTQLQRMGELQSAMAALIKA